MPPILLVNVLTGSVWQCHHQQIFLKTFLFFFRELTLIAEQWILSSLCYMSLKGIFLLIANI